MRHLQRKNVFTWAPCWAVTQRFIGTLPTKLYSLGVTWSWIQTAVSPNQQRLHRNRASTEGGLPSQNWYTYPTAVHAPKKLLNLAQVVNSRWITSLISDFVLAGTGGKYRVVRLVQTVGWVNLEVGCSYCLLTKLDGGTSQISDKASPVQSCEKRFSPVWSSSLVADWPMHLRSAKMEILQAFTQLGSLSFIQPCV